MEPKQSFLRCSEILRSAAGRAPRLPDGSPAVATLRAPSLRSLIVAVAAVLWVAPALALLASSTGANAATPTLGLIEVPGANGGLSGVSCYDENSCVAVGSKHGEGFVVSIVNGVLGAVRMVPGTFGLTAVSCPGALTCWAVGTMPYKPSLEPKTTAGAVVRIYDGIPSGASPAIGIPGQPGTSDITHLYGISCLSTTFCVAAGWDFFLAGVVVPIGDFGPGTVTNVSPMSMSGVECELNKWCIADGQTDNSGPTFGEAIYLKGRTLKYENSTGNASISNLAAGACQQQSISLTCITAGTAVTGGGVIYPIVDQLGGTVLDIPGTYDLDGVSCGGTHSCVAVGQS